MNYQSTDQFGEKSNNTVVTAEAQKLMNGLPAKTGVQAVVAIATADATDLATAITLSNANKAKINEILAALKVVS